MVSAIEKNVGEFPSANRPKSDSIWALYVNYSIPVVLLVKVNDAVSSFPPR